MTDQQVNLVLNPKGDAPDVSFRCTGAVMRANPPGAELYAEMEQRDSARLKLRTAAGDRIADVTVHATSFDLLTEETQAIACALYWSWWRRQQLEG